MSHHDRLTPYDKKRTSFDLREAIREGHRRFRAADGQEWEFRHEDPYPAWSCLCAGVNGRTDTKGENRGLVLYFHANGIANIGETSVGCSTRLVDVADAPRSVSINIIDETARPDSVSHGDHAYVLLDRDELATLHCILYERVTGHPYRSARRFADQVLERLKPLVDHDLSRRIGHTTDVRYGNLNFGDSPDLRPQPLYRVVTRELQPGDRVYTAMAENVDPDGTLPAQAVREADTVSSARGRVFEDRERKAYGVTLRNTPNGQEFRRIAGGRYRLTVPRGTFVLVEPVEAS